MTRRRFLDLTIESWCEHPNELLFLCTAGTNKNNGPALDPSHLWCNFLPSLRSTTGEGRRLGCRLSEGTPPPSGASISLVSVINNILFVYFLCEIKSWRVWYLKILSVHIQLDTCPCYLNFNVISNQIDKYWRVWCVGPVCSKMLNSHSEENALITFLSFYSTI